MTISVTAKSQDTFEVVVTTQSTTTHSVTVQDRGDLSIFP